MLNMLLWYACSVCEDYYRLTFGNARQQGGQMNKKGYLFWYLMNPFSFSHSGETRVLGILTGREIGGSGFAQD